MAEEPDVRPVSRLTRSNLEDDFLGVKQPSPEEIKERDKVAFDEHLVRLALLERLLQMSEFRKWMMELLVEFNTFNAELFPASPVGFPDRDAVQFYLGQRAAGWRLWTIFDDAFPEMASAMRREFLAKPVPKAPA